jgi:hypothetical protein
MAQVIGHEVDGKGDHFLTLDDGRTLHVPSSPELIGAGWGQVLAAYGLSSKDGVPAEKPKGKTRSG